MPNLRYKRGADKERRLVNQLRSEGFIAARSAGSHSPIDVWAVHPGKRLVCLYQCKPASMQKKDKSPNAEAERILEELKQLDGTYTLITGVEFTKKWTTQSST